MGNGQRTKAEFYSGFKENMSEPVKTKKPVVIFTAYDEANAPYAKLFRNSLKKFHPDIPLYEVQGDELKAYLAADPMFFYKQKPVIAEKLIKEYELVIGMDCDQIVTGDLSYLWNTKDYDVATVLNWNRKDQEEYGLVAGWGIIPIEYFNCGLVAMRNEKFIKNWSYLCTTPQFERMQYKEQDILNAMCYYGNWNVRCLDHLDPLGGNNSWWGLLSKGSWQDAFMRNNEIIIPQGKDGNPFPPKEVSLKVIHWGGGSNSPDKMNYRIKFNDDVVKRLDYLVSDIK